MTVVMALALARQTDGAGPADRNPTSRFSIGRSLDRAVQKEPVMRTDAAQTLTKERYDQICERLDLKEAA